MIMEIYTYTLNGFVVQIIFKMGISGERCNDTTVEHAKGILLDGMLS